MIDTLRCQQCGEQFSPKRKTAKYCSDSCKRDFNRHKEKIETKVEEVKLDPIDEPCPSKHQIDKDFWNDRARRGFTTLLTDEREANCVLCKKKFKTQLEHMRFCSSSCWNSIGIFAKLK